jgi:hypothetical protein
MQDGNFTRTNGTQQAAPSRTGESSPDAGERLEEPSAKADPAIHCLPHRSPRVRANPQTTTPTEHVGVWIGGGDEEDRTPDLRIANAAQPRPFPPHCFAYTFNVIARRAPAVFCPSPPPMGTPLRIPWAGRYSCRRSSASRARLPRRCLVFPNCGMEHARRRHDGNPGANWLENSQSSIFCSGRRPARSAAHGASALTPA